MRRTNISGGRTASLFSVDIYVSHFQADKKSIKRFNTHQVLTLKSIALAASTLAEADHELARTARRRLRPSCCALAGIKVEKNKVNEKLA